MPGGVEPELILFFDDIFRVLFFEIYLYFETTFF